MIHAEMSLSRNIYLTISLTLLLTICFHQTPTFAADSPPCVNTTTGRLCGFHDVLPLFDKQYSLYFGIPYAEPPVAENRFLAPKPKSPWPGTFQANNPVTPMCSQPDTKVKNETKLVGQEDCLFLNIYAPANGTGFSNRDQKLPVMFWIYGGAYYFGSAAIYDGRGLVAIGNVIVVTVNYRLGPLGFGYLPLTQMRGNMGLLDQRMALQWVSDNIAQFGGDPGQITIFGESAGAGSVSAHLAAEKSRKLYRNAITESGSILCQWALKDRVFMGELTTLVAKYAGCFNKTSFQLTFDCLKGKSTLALIEAHAKLISSDNGMFLSPVNNDELFFGGDAFEMQKSSNFSGRTIMVGTNNDEGASFVNGRFPDIFKDYNALTEKDYFTYGLQLANMVPVVTQYVLLDYYRPPRCQDYFKSIVQLSSDLFIGCCGGQDAVKVFVPSAEKSFIYLFNHTTDFTHLDEVMGAYHSVELQFVFGAILLNKKATSAEKQLSMDMMTYWTNIAKIGKPTVNDAEWPAIAKPSNSGQPIQLPFKVLRTGDQPVSMNHKEHECTFWENFNPLIPKDGRNYVFPN